MRYLRNVTIMVLTIATLGLYSCGDDNSEDSQNTEDVDTIPKVDSTKIPVTTSTSSD